ncbi:MAG TPA: recombinase RecQ, partial [Nitrosospira sp.]|nr:recombinase RecQ [Nitrosospira sp.]
TEQMTSGSDKSRTKQEQEVAVGAEVEVWKVGKGKVVSIRYDMVTVLFSDNQKHTFMKSCVKPLQEASEK